MSNHDVDWARAHTVLTLASPAYPVPDLTGEPTITDRHRDILAGPTSTGERTMWATLAAEPINALGALHERSHTHPRQITKADLDRVDRYATQAIDALTLWLSSDIDTLVYTD